MIGFAELMWVRVPTTVSRFSRMLGLVLADGAYLRAWPLVAVIVPIAAAVLGALLGGVYGALTGEALFAASFLVVALMAVPAGFGAGVGFAAWSGFVVSDLVLTDRGSLPGFDPYLTSGFMPTATRGYVPLVMAYLLLLGLLVVVPLVARAFAARAEAVAGRSQKDLAIPAGGGVLILVMAGLAYAWALAAPVMIRPLWTFSGENPDPDVLGPVQNHPILLAVLAGAAGVGRLVLSAIASTRPDGRPEPIAARPHRGWVSATLRIAGVPFQALIATLLLAGLVTGVLRGALFGLFVLGILAIRVLVVPMIPGYARVVRRAPLLLRIMACVAAAYALALFAVQPWLAGGDRSLTMIVAVAASLIVATFFLPGPPVWAGTRLAGPAPATDLTGSLDPSDLGDFGDFGDLGGAAGRRGTGRHKAREPEPHTPPEPSEEREPRKSRGSRTVPEPRVPLDESPEPDDDWMPAPVVPAKARQTRQAPLESPEPDDDWMPAPVVPAKARQTRQAPVASPQPDDDRIAAPAEPKKVREPRRLFGRRKPSEPPAPAPPPPPSDRRKPSEPDDDWRAPAAPEPRKAPEPRRSPEPKSRRAPEPTPEPERVRVPERAREPEPAREPPSSRKKGREPKPAKEPKQPKESRKSRRGKPEDDDLAGWPGLLRRSVSVVAGGLVLATASPAYAESCTRLADDCSLAVNIAPTATGITLVLLTLIMLPEILAGGVAPAGDETGNADEAPAPETGPERYATY